MITDCFHVRAMRPEEIELAADWAAREGWNPGLADPGCFATADPGGFLLGELGETPAAIISVINYDASFAFLGFYIVRPDRRGRGYGWRIWQAGIAHAASRTIGLDGVLAQQENYKKSGFVLAYRNVRFGGLRHIALDRDGLAARLGNAGDHGIRALLIGGIADDDGGARGTQRLGDGGSDALGGAGNDGDFSCKSAHDLIFPIKFGVK